LITLEYREKNNTPNLLASVRSNVCEKIYSGELEPEALAKLANMFDLKNNKVIPPLNQGQGSKE
jgi:hypothetical protein